MNSLTVCPNVFFLNFILYENDSLYQEINWRENPTGVRVTPANESSFAIIDTTGLTAIMEIRIKGDTVTPAVLTLTESSGITFAGNVSPNIIINISKTQIAAIGPGNFAYDLVCTNSVGNRFTLLSGDIVIRPNITQVA